MANPQWPTSLQKYVNMDSFEYTFGSTVLRSEQDIGPAKVRQRFTRGVDMIKAGIDIQGTVDFETFETFFKTDIAGGSRVFDFNHPIKQVPIAVRMIDPPVVRAKGGLVFMASFALEVMP